MDVIKVRGARIHNLKNVNLDIPKGKMILITGVSGSGKSSFLLGICVALGDTYTERSKKLSDLIRWGQERARVTLLLDNSTKEDGHRPITRFDNDTIRLTRNLRNDGKYWFEINQRSAQKYEVTDMLNELGFDPSNMLIIMHQSMPTRFAALPPREKLKILEAAVGFESYRSDVIEAKKKLGGILSEESSLTDLLDRARETLGYWREQNERLQIKRQHKIRLTFLQREMAWSRVATIENHFNRLERDFDNANKELQEAEDETERNGKLVIDTKQELNQLQRNWEELVENRVEHERIIGICEYTIQHSKDQLLNLQGFLESTLEKRKRFETEVQNIRKHLQAGPTTLDDFFNIFNVLQETQEEAYDAWDSRIQNRRVDLNSNISQLSERLNEAEAGAHNVIQEMNLVSNYRGNQGIIALFINCIDICTCIQ